MPILRPTVLDFNALLFYLLRNLSKLIGCHVIPSSGQVVTHGRLVKSFEAQMDS